MADIFSRLWHLVNDETLRSLLLFLLASVLGVASLLLFFRSASGSPTQFHFALLVCSMVVVFYLSFRATQF